MPFLTYQQSERAGEPIELYKFTSPSNILRYTSFDVDVVYNTEPYIHLAGIKRGTPEQTGSFEVAWMNVQLPSNTEIVKRFTGFAPPYSTWLNIARFHNNDPDLEAYNFWHGLVRGVKVNGSIANLQCEPFLSIFKRLGLRRFYQNLCNHVLYDTGCRLDKDLFKVVDTIGMIDGLTVQVPIAATFPNQWFRGGMIQTTSGDIDQRLIVDQVGQDLTLVAPFDPDIVVSGDTVNLYYGCAHDVGTCRVKFNNVVNYGGFPFVPTKNIFTIGLRG